MGKKGGTEGARIPLEGTEEQRWVNQRAKDGGLIMLPPKRA